MYVLRILAAEESVKLLWIHKVGGMIAVLESKQSVTLTAHIIYLRNTHSVMQYVYDIIVLS